jgi:soluble lytic murein transglycosylase
MTQTKRIFTIFLIIILSLGVGLGVHFLWNLWEDEQQEEKNSVTFATLIEKYSDEYDVPKELVFAVIKVESGFDPEAESSVGALGLMQMMPKTFEWLTGEEHLDEHLSFEELTDPEVSIRYGTYYLRYLYLKFENWDTVLAAYNGGEGNVAKWLTDPECSDGNGNLTYIPFEETRNYVKKVNAAMAKYENDPLLRKEIK